MPRLINDDESMTTNTLTGKFTFSCTKISKLGATEYTLVTIGVDFSGSVDDFEDEIRNCIKTAMESCKKSPRSENLLIRVFFFSGLFSNGIEEIHGFKPLSEISFDDYNKFSPGGMTPLCDATYSAFAATNAYAKQLMDNDFTTNAIVFIITDGLENDSVATALMAKEESMKGIRGEYLESMISILVGINVSKCKAELAKFQTDTSINQYSDAGTATPGHLAKLAEFVSQSISSQSQALGTGGPSQNISATI